MGRDMRSVKCEAAAEVIGVLQRAEVAVLYLEGFALDAQLQLGTHFSDELQLLIQHGQLDDFMGAMGAGGYVPALYDPQAGRCRPLDPQQARRAVLKIPVSPEPFYVGQRWASESGEPDLLIRFHTTKRHGRLLLADLGDWFVKPQPVTVMADTAQATQVDRPPLWAMMLWQVGEVMNHASDCAIAKDELEKLYLVAQQQQQSDWGEVLRRARQYSADYDSRINSAAARELLEDYRDSLGISEQDLDQAERQYGALYELAHGLKALWDYEGSYRAAVDEGVWAAVRQITEDRPRKLWGYPGGQEDVPGPCTLGRLGVADGAFGIKQQIEEHSGADFDYLVYHRLARVLLRGCPPHGPWANCTARRLNMIFDP